MKKLKSVLKQLNKAVIKLNNKASHTRNTIVTTIKSNVIRKVYRTKKLEIRIENIKYNNTMSFKEILKLDKERKEKKQLRDAQEEEMNKLRCKPLQLEDNSRNTICQSDFLAVLGLCSTSSLRNIPVTAPRMHKRTRRTGHGQKNV